jgi:DNA-binding LacI/PurR family transcriptional regulator
VSRALRGHPGIPQATRDRVEAAARQGGYRPDAWLAGLSRRRWQAESGAIAYVSPHADPRHDNYALAVRRAARASGMTVQILAGDLSDLERRLQKDQVRGVLLGQRLGGTEPHLDHRRYALVHLGVYLPPERGDIVMADLLEAVPRAWRELVSLGFKRIAVVLTLHPASLSESILAGTLTALVRGNDACLAWVGDDADQDGLAAWLRWHEPDVVLTYGDGRIERLRRLGCRAPVAVLAGGDHRAHRGILVPFDDLARLALDVLRDKMRLGDLGLGGIRRIHLVPMPWRWSCVTP